ncbi:MAG: hypothetical protein GDA43_04175 [Hormoscilla sp. SP5CHS1]|nr:hypothetical protein [Hormoscilla sp. SP12CHS1]MBC6452486.1 hypothetical protein [Hormoscilla sp. SP5CHS1]MBC6471740.1 hypothetical protein [Hormoscilla sp. GM102CHS1]
MTIAQQLQQKLKEIEKQTQANPSLGIDLKALPVLNQILKHRSSAGAEFDSQGQGTLVIEL